MKIVTIVPFLGHLNKKFFNKDIIQIGRTFMIQKKFTSEFWTIEKNKSNKDFILKEQKWIGYSNFFKIGLILIIQSKKIDLLHLYHLSRYSFSLAIIYKLFNPKGKIYLKTDVSFKSFHGKGIFNINKYLLKILYSRCNYIGFEDKYILEKMGEKFPTYKNKFFFIPSGTIYIKEYENNIQKENSISLCGRFGDPVKNYELFLDTLKINNVGFLKNWKVFLIGDYTASFHDKVNNLIKAKPELKNIIELTGFIGEKNDVYKFLSKSKLFIHTANSEGEPNVQFDAMFCGCYMISTDVGTIKYNYPGEYSDYIAINNKQELYNSIKTHVEKINHGKNPDYIKIQKHCLANFIWEKSLQPVLDKFN